MKNPHSLNIISFKTIKRKRISSEDNSMKTLSKSILEEYFLRKSLFKITYVEPSITCALQGKFLV